jgi:hypothetical protein
MVWSSREDSADDRLVAVDLDHAEGTRIGQRKSPGGEAEDVRGV